MRMTNKIMQNNSLYNINNNKMLTNKLSAQMATGKKITRPSDDPVIAIRALRLRSDVSQITQFYGKNAPDAESWLKVTEDALGTTGQVLKSMYEQIELGANKDYKASELDIVITQLKSLRDEFYATGNVDSAGRYIFTGYRTDTTLTYTEDTKQDFSITEQLDTSAIDKINYTNIGDLDGLSGKTYDPTAGVGESETNITNGDIYRFRLSYDKLKNGKPTITTVDDPNAVPPTETELVAPGDIEVISAAADPNPYDYIQANPDKAVLIPETGELLIGSDMYEASFTGLGADEEIRINYEKDSWKDGDMRPQHYFACEDLDKGIEYNYSKNEATDPPTTYISCGGESQIIEYDVGYNQRIRINTTASEVFTMDVDRNIDDLEKSLAKLKEIENTMTTLGNRLENMDEGEPGYANLQATYNAAKKAHTYIREDMQKQFEGMVTKVQGTMDNTTVAVTDNGTRSSRLDLISNRLMTQKTTFETLQSANEDVDVTEVTIQLTSMENSYQSALMATAKVLQNSLMNYI